MMCMCLNSLAYALSNIVDVMMTKEAQRDVYKRKAE